MTDSPSWTHDSRERARFLDGEGDLGERAARAADLVRDPEAAARVARDAEFLEVARRAGDESPEPSEAFEGRVRRALAADRAAGFPSPVRRVPARVMRRLSLAAAATLVAVGATIWATAGKAPEASAAGREARIAADAYLEAARSGPSLRAGTTCEPGRNDPRAFPPVRAGELSLASCAPAAGGDGTGLVAVLRRPDEPADPRGLLVVPWDGKSTSTDVGWTRVGEVVVFDVAIGGSRYYLATRWGAVAGTASCAACHGPVRAGTPARNPHAFVERTAVVTK